MTHLKIAQTFEGSGSLQEGGEVVAIFSGRGTEHEPERERLSRIVEVINGRYGLDLGEADQLLFDQFEEAWAADETLRRRFGTRLSSDIGWSFSAAGIAYLDAPRPARDVPRIRARQAA